MAGSVLLLLLSQEAPVLADGSSSYAYVPSRDPADGRVWEYALDNNEQLIPLGQSQAAGLDPFPLAVAPFRRFLYVTTFTQQDIAMFAIDAASGRLRLLSTARTGLTPESAAVAANGEWVFVARAADHRLWVYKVDPTSDEKLQLYWKPHAGQNPTSVAAHPFFPWVYVTDYSNNRVYTFEQDLSTGELQFRGEEQTGDRPKVVAAAPNGAFAYVASFGSNDLTEYTIDASTGVLTKRDTTQTGWGPRAIAIGHDNHLLYTAGQYDESLTGFTIDRDTGLLTFQERVEPTERFPWALAVRPL